VTVVSDTSALSYLVLIGHIEVLRGSSGSLTIPEEVARELRHPKAPAPIREWIASAPDWLVVHPTGETDLPKGPALSRLHPGERAAIQLAERAGAILVLLDDRAARTAAEACGLTVTGVLGVLKTASAEGLLHLPEAIERLRRTNFRASPALLRSMEKDP